MRDRLKAASGWLVVSLFLALPNCTLDSSGLLSPQNLERGSSPRSSAVFCDIENMEVSRHCASSEEQLGGIRIASAAIALTTGQTSNIGLDDSPAAGAALGCAPGVPVAVTFRCPFPQGCPVCLNCAVIGDAHPTAAAACVAHCEDINSPIGLEVPPMAPIVTFCEANAKVSTNAVDPATSNCFAGVCTDAGAPNLGSFSDPRVNPEPVEWTNPSGVDVVGNTLTKNTPDLGAFDAGAASTQTVTQGDAYVEFTVDGPDGGRALGLSTGAPPDTDYTTADLGFAFRISGTGNIFIAENGTLLTGPIGGAYATATPGDKLRITVTDNFDGTALVKYTRFPAGMVGSEGDVLREMAGPVTYPLRVDASLRGAGATLIDVRIVRIK